MRHPAQRRGFGAPGLTEAVLFKLFNDRQSAVEPRVACGLTRGGLLFKPMAPRSPRRNLPQRDVDLAAPMDLRLDALGGRIDAAQTLWRGPQLT